MILFFYLAVKLRKRLPLEIFGEMTWRKSRDGHNEEKINSHVKIRMEISAVTGWRDAFVRSFPFGVLKRRRKKIITHTSRRHVQTFGIPLCCARVSVKGSPVCNLDSAADILRRPRASSHTFFSFPDIAISGEVLRIEDSRARLAHARFNRLSHQS